MEGLAVIKFRFFIGSAPINSILDDALNVFIFERFYRLVTCVEVEYLTKTASVGNASSEDVAILKPSAEDDLIGLRNIKRLAVKLLGELEAHRNTLSYGVPRSEIPYDGLLVSAPSKVSGTADYTLEGL